MQKTPEEDRKGKKALEEEEEEEEEKRLEKNREASAQYRQRKDNSDRDLSFLFDDQERLRAALSHEKSFLEGQLYALRRLVFDHAYCDGSLIQQYLQAEAINVVERAFYGRAPAPNSAGIIPPHGFQEDAPAPPPATVTQPDGGHYNRAV